MQRKDLALRVLSTAAIMSIVTSIAAPAFADIYYIGNGSIDVVNKEDADGKKYVEVKQGDNTYTDTSDEIVIKDGTSEDELAKYLDLNVAPFTWEATKNYLQDANTKYNEGLIDPEFYLTTDDSLAKGKFVSGQCATYSFYMSNGTDVFDSLKANDPNAEVAVLGSTVSGTVADGYAAHY